MIDDLLTLLYFMQSHIVQAPAWVLDSLSPYEIKFFPRHLSVFAAWRQGSGVGASSCSPHLSQLGQVRWRCLPAGRSFCQGLPKKTMWNDPSRMKEPQEQVLLGVPQEQVSPQRSRVWPLGTQPGCGVDQPFICSMETLLALIQAETDDQLVSIFVPMPGKKQVSVMYIFGKGLAA